MQKLSTILLYIVWTLILWGYLFAINELIIIGICLWVFYMISEQYDACRDFFIKYHIELGNEHMLSLLLWIVLFILNLYWYFNNPEHIIVMGISIFMIYSSLHLLSFNSIKRLLLYPTTWALLWFEIIWIGRWFGSKAISAYQEISLEKARIREAIENTNDDRHPPLMWPWIVKDPDSIILK